MMTSATEKRFNLAFNIFLVTGMLLAVTVTTMFKVQQPGVGTFMLLLAAFGSVMGVVNTVMSANGNILTFVFGFIDVLIGTIVYFDNGIMGNFALHAFYFLPMQAMEQERSESAFRRGWLTTESQTAYGKAVGLACGWNCRRHSGSLPYFIIC